MEIPDDSVRRDVALAGPEATAALAETLAKAARPGDVIALRGDLGAGKTAFARAFIRAREVMSGGAGATEVPSPTFTLVQTYQMPIGDVWHFDLYRLDRSADAYELGLDEAMAEGIVLIEWPERLGSLLPADRLDLALRFGAGEDARVAAMIGFGERGRRLVEAVPA
ncbi:tRNA threonylcarbamoyladenosine biosynthesis protein TsaE [Constrictibacter sp. MBR-5]|jgi:tRNA threonylcarbamoyladenosine biosynthesis protein TsaE|uniref:tRNA (adenosine(37)-N6)-threonylcarbamoyltransferase complex ATPase subunit type 1 TsaE n=1 Tax=Constrictibacter sp. MBR-5 TaxID=3156467 RepID=UPI003390E076